MNKLSLWISAIIICCIVGLAAVIFCTLSKPIVEVSEPPQICLTKKFLGRAVLVDDLKPEDYTPFENLEFSNEDTKLSTDD